MIVALRHVLAGIGAAAPEELPPTPVRLGVALERRRRPAASGRLAVWGDTAHLTSLDDAMEGGTHERPLPADSILARVGPVPDGPHAHQVYEAALTDRSLITR
ncbi:hypothetical protein ACH4NS_34090 [Streptomyces mutabilis]|uniref:hypothetical protein n=1 Tax=Streptomyces mutabilis TaxID=67332 RepID=UPI0036B514E6